MARKAELPVWPEFVQSSGSFCSGNYLTEKLEPDENSRVLCLSDDGDTDWQNSRRIVWDEQYPDHA